MIGRKKRSTEEDRARALKKGQEKRRKKMVRTKYGQAPLKHARRGANSCFFGAGAALLLALLFVLSYVREGHVGILSGFAGLFVLVLSWYGITSALQGFKERDKNYIMCKVGLACNAVLFVGLIAIFLRGLF